MVRVDVERVAARVSDWLGAEGPKWPEAVEARLIEAEGLPAADASRVVARTRGILGQKVLPPIAKIELFLTEDCTNRCDYCFVRTKDEHNYMSVETALQAVDWLFSVCGDREEVRILFFGGEPLLNFEVIRQVTLHAERLAREHGKKLSLDMTTNAIPFTREKLAFVAEHGIKFLLSLDGDRETHDAHRRLKNGKGTYGLVAPRVMEFKQYQPWMGSRITVRPDTLGRLAANVMHLHSIGVNQFIIGAADGAEWPQDLVDEYTGQWEQIADFYIQTRRKGGYMRITELEEPLDGRPNLTPLWGCQAGRDSVCVSWDGDIYPCSKMLSACRGEGVSYLGNVWDGITDIEERGNVASIWHPRREKCESCDLSWICTGGCPALNWEANGSVHVPCEFDCMFKRHEYNLHERVDGKLKEAGLLEPSKDGKKPERYAPPNQ
ncbi:MAG: SPASM domain-containing protein [Candidatus Coatesbacteria bacterium]|nr:SPASM domain-containing protein [Candidatus Coatesbacteria bacterium]